MEGNEKDRNMKERNEFWANIEKEKRNIIQLSRKGMVKLSAEHHMIMYNQNRNKYQGTCYWNSKELVRREMGMLMYQLYPVSIPNINEIKARVITVDKFTIVELLHNNKHYHGLTARAKCDSESIMTAIYIAYNRAFQSMIGLSGGGF